MTIGIYALRFTGTDKVYIGQCSTDIEKIRYKQHLSLFKNNKHSKKLQEAYNTYGIPTIEVICECFIEELNKLENEAIEIFDSFNNGFNSLEFAEDTPSSDNRGENHGMSKYSNEQIVKVFNLLINNPEKLHKEISLLTNVSRSVIGNIAAGNDHCWLKDKYPEEYKILISLKGTKYISAKWMGIIYPIILSPEGIKYNIENLCKFARKHNLDQSALCKILQGKRKTHKGWRLV